MATPTLRDAHSLRDGRWYRLHPLTPVLRGGVIVAGVIGLSFAWLWETVVLRVILSVIGIEESEQPEIDFVGGFIDSVSDLSLSLLVVAVVVAVAIWLQWREHQVRLDDDVIEVKRGVIFRSSRRARRDRVNAVGIRRPLIPRLLGLAKLDIQAAGSDANVVLAYLPHETAKEVRREILEPARAVAGEGEEPEVATRVVDVPLGRYFAALVLSVETLGMVAGVIAATALALASDELTTWLGVVIVLIVYVSYLADRFFRVGSFVIDQVDGDIRVSLGLLATSVETIPPVRFHALQVSQPWPWRFVGWWRIDANLASSPGSQNKNAPATTVICPVATTEEMLRIVGLCLPLGSGADTEAMLRNGLEMPNSAWSNSEPAPVEAVVSRPSAKYLIPLSAHVNRAWRYGDVVYFRVGTWVRRLIMVPLARVQSVGVSIGPLHDALGLARFSIHGVPGPVSTRIPALGHDDATAWWERVSSWAVGAIAGSAPKARRKRATR